MYKKINFFGGAIVISVILTLGLSISLQNIIASWTAPNQAPPIGNTNEPLNAGNNAQTKNGKLTLNSGDGLETTTMVVTGTANTSEQLKIVGQNNKEGLVITAKNYSPLAIKNSANLDLFRVNQYGVAAVNKLKIKDVVALNDSCSENGLIAVDASNGQLICNGSKYQYPAETRNVHRYSFFYGSGINTSDTFYCNDTCNWTVPAGVRFGYITMAGGGASGGGYAITNSYNSGNSAGYVQNAPVNFTAGEVLKITVGKKGAAYPPLDGGDLTGSCIWATDYPGRYYIMNSSEPATPYPGIGNDRGTRGWPGTLSRVRKASDNTDILECSGGGVPGTYINTSGAFSDITYMPRNGSLARGHTTGSIPGVTLPSRPSLGTYGSTGPGRCGPSSSLNYGIGVKGLYSFAIVSGAFNGGETAIRFGSGGAIGVTGCYTVSSCDPYTPVGTCIIAHAAMDGVVFIDVIY